MLAAGDRFFLADVALDPEAGAVAQIELALEETSPFPLAQVYHGAVVGPDRRRALGFAAYRRRFTAPEMTEWPAADAVVPAFLALLGPPLSGPRVVVHADAGNLMGVAWDGQAGLPVAVLARNAAAGADAPLAGLIAELCGRVGLAEAEAQCLEGPIGIGRDESGDAVFRIGGHETARFTPEALAGADIRDKSFLEEKQRRESQGRRWWRAFLAVGALLLLALGLDLAAGAAGVWNQRRGARVAEQDAAVKRVETAQTLAVRIEDLAARQQRPLEWLGMAAAVRPRSVQFLRVAGRPDRTLEIEAQTVVAADIASFEAALRQLAGIQQVETRDLRSREGLATFVVALKFKAGSPPARREEP